VDGELSPRHAFRVRKHLHVCSGCRLYKERLEKMRLLVRDGLRAGISENQPDLEKLYRNIQMRISASDPASAGRTGGFRAWRFSPALERFLFPLALVSVLITAWIFTIYKPRTFVLKREARNECFVDSIESQDRSLLLFQTHGSEITVIWVHDMLDPKENGGNGVTPVT